MTRTVRSDLNLKFGPVATIGRYLHCVERVLTSHGISLRVSSLDEIARVNQLNRDSWSSYLPIFDPQFHGDATPSFAIVGETSSGQIVATMAARRFNWPDSNFTTEAEALRLMYAAPEKHALPNEQCKVTASAGKGIAGEVVYSGAAWYHPTARGLGLFEILPCVSRSVAHSLWRSDCTVSVSSKTLISKKVTQRAGYSNLEFGVEVRNSRIGDMELGLVWSKTAEMLADLESRLAKLEAVDQANTTMAVSRLQAS
ncbi:MAG: hypothetical protein ACKVP7_21730 [Hyphomicrobiaceae bacterium]